MNRDPSRTLARIEREVGLAVRLTQLQFRSAGAHDRWRPSLNAFRCADRFMVCVELAGVDRAAIEVVAEPQRLSVRGRRAVLEPSCDQPQPLHVLALEIDHGAFERVLDLPDAIDPERVTAEQRDGILWIQLPLRACG